MVSESAVTDTRACPRCAETIKAAAKVCRFCGAELRPDGTSLPPMIQYQPKPGGIGATIGTVTLIVIAVAVLFFLSVVRLGSSANSTWDRIAEEARNSPVPSGEHCLDPSLGGLHADLWLQVKHSLHEPGSMQDMVMSVEPVNANQQHKIRFQFRAKNAYGALRLQTVEAYVMAMGCVLIRWELV